MQPKQSFPTHIEGHSGLWASQRYIVSKYDSCVCESACQDPSVTHQPVHMFSTTLKLFYSYFTVTLFYFYSCALQLWKAEHCCRAGHLHITSIWTFIWISTSEHLYTRLIRIRIAPPGCSFLSPVCVHHVEEDHCGDKAGGWVVRRFRTAAGSWLPDQVSECLSFTVQLN